MGDEKKTDEEKTETEGAPIPDILNEPVEEPDAEDALSSDEELFEDDPFMEEWDDAEMAQRQAEWQRLLDDAESSADDDLVRVGNMTPDEQAYLGSMSAGEFELPAIQPEIEQ